jgi:hypothetical protein
MPKITKSQLLSATAAAEAARPEVPDMRRAQRATSPKLLNTRRRMGKLLAASFAKDGIDTEEFEQIREQYSAEMQRVVERQEATAAQRAPKAREVLRAVIANRRKALETLLTLPLAPPYLYVLDRPFLIWGAPHSNILIDTHIEPWNSWAKIRVVAETGGDHKSGEERLSFYFIWENETDYYAVIDASTVLAAHGACRARAEGGLGYLLLPPPALLSATANLRLWQWSAQPQTWVATPPSTVFELAAEAGVFEDTRTTSVWDSFDLDYRSFAVQPRGVVVIEVILAVSYHLFDGHVLANFADGSYEVGCPFVVVGLLSAPPPMTPLVATSANA